MAGGSPPAPPEGGGIANARHRHNDGGCTHYMHGLHQEHLLSMEQFARLACEAGYGLACTRNPKWEGLTKLYTLLALAFDGYCS